MVQPLHVPEHAQSCALAAMGRRRCLQSVLAVVAAITLLAFLVSRDPRPNSAQAAPVARQLTGSVQSGPSQPGAQELVGSPGPISRQAHRTKTAAPTDFAPASSLAADGIPSTALAAYQLAAARETTRDPGCGIPWTLLAAIGRVESDHGRFAGAVLHTDGLSTPPVIGIALDGVGTEVIRDTDHGRLDGDTTYDRAVGPMQFIPSTWAVYGVDADGDGQANPFDIYDAAAAAADYLCAAGGNLTTPAGVQRAVLAYNHSEPYLAAVLGLMAVYAHSVEVVPTNTSPGSPGPATRPVPSSSAQPATTPKSSLAAKPTAKSGSPSISRSTCPPTPDPIPTTTTTPAPDPIPATATTTPAPNPDPDSSSATSPSPCATPTRPTTTRPTPTPTRPTPTPTPTSADSIRKTASDPDAGADSNPAASQD